MQKTLMSHRTERVIIVSIRKDVLPSLKFHMPIGEGLNRTLRELLDDTVDDRYRIKDVQIIYPNEAQPTDNIFDSNPKKMQAFLYVGDKALKINGGRYDTHFNQNRAVCRSSKYAYTLVTSRGGGCHEGKVLIEDQRLLRLITPKETFRLQGFDDSDYEKVKHFSERELWTFTGNSICVPVLEAIFKQLYKRK